MTVAGSVVKLTFNYSSNGLTSYGKELSCFEVAGANKLFYPAKAFITGTGITLFSPSVAEPVAVRYAFKDFIVGDLLMTMGTLCRISFKLSRLKTLFIHLNRRWERFSAILTLDL